MLNYNHLHYFHVAASEGSVAAAAEKLGVTQPTVSEQVRALERTLGINLFERTPMGLKLTEAGRLTFEHTSVMFRASERLVESLGQAPAVPRSLRVALSNAAVRATATHFLLPLFAIEDAAPVIRSGDTAELIRDLKANELDLVLCENDLPKAMRAGLESVLVDRVTLVAVAPPHVEPSADWHELGMVHYRPSSSYRWDVEQFLDERGLRPRIAGEVDDPQFLVEASIRGGYIVVVPRTVARDAITAGRLRIIALVDTAHSGVHALYLDSQSADLARRAVEMLVARARE